MDKDYLEPENKNQYKMKNPDYSFSKREIWLVLIILLLIVGVGAYVFFEERSDKQNSISSFEECAAAGNPIMESFPEQCAANGQTFVKQY